MQQLEFKKPIKDITIFILLILLIGTSIYALVLYNKNEEALSQTLSQNDKSINSTLIVERISGIQELATTKYYYTNVVSYKENMKINDIEIPFTQKGFLIKYDGYLKAGIDINSIKILSESTDQIKISISKPKVLDHTIDEKSVNVYDEKNSVFNNIKIKDVFDILLVEKKKMEDKIIENGFLEEVDKNTRLVLENMLKSMGFTSVEIIYEGN